MKYKFLFLACAMLFQFLAAHGQAITGTVTHETSVGAHDGTITIIINNGISPYTFSWSGPNGYTSSSKNISGLAPGQYCVTVTDALCGTATYCDIVKGCNPILAVATGAECPYNSNGYFAIVLSGAAPYKIEWSDGQVDNGVTSPFFRRKGLTLGAYCVTVTNAYGCSESICRAVVSNIQPIQIQGNVTQPSCGNFNGSIILSVTGGSIPLTYKWSDNASIKDRANIPAGTYTVTATDYKGCTNTANFTISPFTSNLKINISSLAMASDCQNHICDGSINIEPSGGTAPYGYRWSGPNGFSSNQQDISNLCPGIYYVTLTETTGCTKTESINICCCNAEPGNSGGINEYGCYFSNLSISGQVNQATSFQGGSINLNITGVLSNYSLEWKKNGQFYSYDKNITNLQPGTYCVTIGNGCSSKSKCFTIVNCDNVNILISGAIEPVCQNYTEGKIIITTQGGTSPYLYKWSNGNYNQNLSGLPAGTYTVTVSDLYGCTNEKSFTVTTTQITIENQGCTQITKCGNQVVNVQQFSPYYQTNPNDCSLVRAVCANGYVGPWEYVAPTIRYPYGPTGCVIQYVCKNGQVMATFSGQQITESIGSILPSCGLSCVRVRYCYYPGLNGYDPNSVQVLGNGNANYQFIKSSTNCNCYDPCCWIYYAYCDGEYVGVTEAMCGAVTSDLSHPNDTSNIFSISGSELIHAIDTRHPEYASHLFATKQESQIYKPTEERNLSNHINEEKYSFQLTEVYPNPFENEISVKLSSRKVQSVKIDLYNSTGQFIKTERFSLELGITNITYLVNENLPAGSYFLRVTDEFGNTENKLIVKIN